MTVDETQFRDALSVLQRTDAQGTSLYDHLTSVIARILEEQPQDGIHALETISRSIQGSSLTQETKQGNAFSEETGSIAAEVLRLFRKRDADPDENGEVDANEDAEVNDDVEVPDMLDDAHMLENAGVALGGRTDIYRLTLSVQRLARSTPGIASARIFGKILGTKSDYFVVEAVRSEIPESANDRAKQHNRFAYYVTSAAHESWSMLPDVTPAQIEASTHIRRYFTGDLTKPILSYPPFPNASGTGYGTEAELLRAQLARIGADTVISPTNFFVDDEDAGELAVNDDYSASIEDLAEKTQWNFHYPALPRAKNKVNGEGDADEDSEADGAEEEDDEEEAAPRLRSVASEEGEVPFTVRTAPIRTPQYATVALRSLQWPGAVTVATASAGRARFANLYIGYGSPQLPHAYTLPPPPPLQDEAEDPIEQEEPPLPQPEPNAGEQEDNNVEDGGEDDGEDDEA